MDNPTGNGRPYMPQRREGTRQKWKDLLAVILAILGVCLALRLFFYALLKPTLIQALPSPDGQYVAYVYEMNPGATSGFIYHLSILKAGTPLLKRDGNTYKSKYDFTVEWQSGGELHVNNLDAGIYKQKTEIDGITVTYDIYLDD